MKTEIEEEVSIREATYDDINYITNSWISSARESLDKHPICNEIFFPNHSSVITSILSKTIPMIACYKEYPDVILGYVVYELRDDILIVDWINVKKAFRRMKVADCLIDHLENGPGRHSTTVMFTHLPRNDHNYILDKAKYKYKAIYNPYLQYRFLRKVA